MIELAAGTTRESVKIYLSKNGAQNGPFSDEQVRGMLTAALISPDDLAWHKARSTWQPLREILGLSQPPPIPSTPPATDEADRHVSGKSLKGVGGWLTFFCVGLTILGPLFSLGQITQAYDKAKPVLDRMPAIKSAVTFEITGSILLLIYGFFVGCIIWSGSPTGRRVARQYLLIRLFGFIGIEAIGYLMISSLPRNILSASIADGWGEIAREMVYFFIWWLYFKKSKRVRNTYGDENAITQTIGSGSSSSRPENLMKAVGHGGLDSWKSPCDAFSEPNAGKAGEEPTSAIQPQKSASEQPIIPANSRISRKSVLVAAGALAFIAISIATWCLTATSRHQTSRQKTRSSVVLIKVFDAANKAIATGSGFFVSADGMLVTNFHVIKGADKIVVKLESGAMYEVSGVLAGDSKSDIVLLRVNANGFPFLKLGDSAKAEIGQRVTVIGSPLGLEGTVSDGIISAKRELPGKEKWLQITAPIAPGSSGSPVLDANSQVLGVATMLIREGQALNFAVPSDVIASLLEKVKGHEELMPFPQPGASDALPSGKTDVATLTSQAEKGDLDAQVQLILLYGKGDPAAHVVKDLARATAMYVRAKLFSAEHDTNHIVTRLANAGFPSAERDLGIDYLNGDHVPADDSQAARWFRKAADHQDDDAMRFLALLYLEGTGVPKDLSAAVGWARKGAGLGNHEAELLLGQLYLKGTGIPKDPDEGEKWILKAATGGVRTAQKHLAFGNYLGAAGLRQNYGEAAKWAFKAAAQGEASAQALLGEMYIHGLGVPKNQLLGYAFANAAESKLKDDPVGRVATATKTSSGQILLPDEIAQADALSAEISSGRFDKVEAEVKRQTEERAAWEAKERPMIEGRERTRRFAPEGTVYNLKPITVRKPNAVIAPETELRLIRKNDNGTVHVQKDNLEADVPAEDVTNDRDWVSAYRTIHAGE